MSCGFTNEELKNGNGFKYIGSTLECFPWRLFWSMVQHWFQKRKVHKVRQIAIKALDVFGRYAKQGQSFDMAASEFNNSLDVVEKRAVLVALCKLGIPVVKPINDLFQ